MCFSKNAIFLRKMSTSNYNKKVVAAAAAAAAHIWSAYMISINTPKLHIAISGVSVAYLLGRNFVARIFGCSIYISTRRTEFAYLLNLCRQESGGGIHS